jgi:hypothetical protein
MRRHRYPPTYRACSARFEPRENAALMENMLARERHDNLFIRVLSFKFKLFLANGTVFP